MAKALVLTGISGVRAGVRYSLSERSNIVGSSIGCTLVLNDRTIDARHAEVKQMLDSWFIVPLSPRNVYLNDKIVDGQARLRPGDSLMIGSYGFKISLEEVEAHERAVGLPATTSIPRLGDYLLRKGMLSQAQLEQAIRRQKELLSQGRRMPLGEVLVHLGYIRSSTLDMILREQQADIHWQD